jgi:hypothetical protein
MRFLLLAALLLTAGLADAEQLRPPPGDSGFAIGLSKPGLAPRVGIGAYDVDLFDTPQPTLDALHAAGGYVICYFSAGSFEDWRPDAARFPDSVLGRSYVGWPGERWLDIRQQNALAPILQARLDLAAQKHCDAVDADNVDGYANDTGFKISTWDQISFNRWLASEAHARGLAIGLKNAAELARELAGTFDFSVVESCAAEGSCAAYKPFVDDGKPVYQIEYRSETKNWKAVCAAAHASGFTAVLTDTALDGWTESCRN